ncbi:thiazole synthase, partial [Desulfovibrio sp. 1188_IL3213]
MNSSDPFILGGISLGSRLFIGTGKYGSDGFIPAVAEASGAEVITVAMRRVDRPDPSAPDHSASQGIMGHIPGHMRLLPN